MKKFRLTKYQNAILLKVQQGEQLCVQGGVVFFSNGKRVETSSLYALLNNNLLKANEDGLFHGCTQTYGASHE